MVDVDFGSLQADSQPSRLAWSEGRRPLGAVLHISNEPGELSQWFCHDDSTINIGICIIIIIIIMIIYSTVTKRGRHPAAVSFSVPVNVGGLLRNAATADRPRDSIAIMVMYAYNCDQGPKKNKLCQFKLLRIWWKIGLCLPY